MGKNMQGKLVNSLSPSLFVSLSLLFVCFVICPFFFFFGKRGAQNVKSCLGLWRKFLHDTLPQYFVFVAWVLLVEALLFYASRW